MCHDWPVKKAIVDLLIRLKRNLKCISVNSVESVGVEHGHYAGPAQVYTNHQHCKVWDMSCHAENGCF